MASYIGKKVYHKSFYGEGTVVSQDNNGLISVKFDSVSELKTFSAPSCFNKYLTLLDKDTSNTSDNSEGTKTDFPQKSVSSKYQESMSRTFERSIQLKQAAGKGKTVEVPKFSSIDSFYLEQEKVLKSEITYLRNNGGKRIKIFNGELVETTNGKYIYSFESDSELNLPDNTQITIWLNGKEEGIPGIVVDCEDFTVIISSSKSIGNSIPMCEFSAETWRLLGFLIDRLETLKSNTSKIVKEIVCEGRNKIVFRGSIAKGQETACQMSLERPITFIWGPPGTGKTETLAKIVHQHLEREHRVLMLSYSNVSVDGAMWRVFNKDTDIKPGVLVRYGYPKDKELLKHEFLTSYNLSLINKPALQDERQKLINERQRLSRTSSRYVEIGKRLTEIRKLLKDEEKRAVRNARFVATTVSKAIADSNVYDQTFDTVIFDEASMAFIPQVVFSAGLAKKHFICMGDFSQLPPIVQSDNTNSLNADIFKFCGISDAVESGYGHEWLCMLDTQYRMHPDIAAFSSKTMYRGLLRSGADMEKKRCGIANSRPFSGNALQLVDLSGMLSVCMKTADKSRINVLSALVSIGLAVNAAKYHEVGIITPYNAQSRLLHAFSRDVSEQNEKLNKITCATVHQFQGSEKDVIIYDAVDCYRMQYPGALLSTAANNYSNRLYNVAVTRAKGKMISVVNFNYMKTKKFSDKFIFRKMMDTLSSEKKTALGETVISEMSSQSLLSFTQPNGETAFLMDISEAKKEIMIDIPGGTSASSVWLKNLTEAIISARKNGVKVVVRTDNKPDLPADLRAIVIEKKFITDPVAIIDKNVIWYGMPASNAVFTTEGKKLPTRYHPILRFRGKNAARALYGFLEMNKTIDAAEEPAVPGAADTYNSFAAFVTGEIRCKECGARMKLIKSKKGKFFLSCSNYPQCEKTQFVEPEMLDEYFYYKNPEGKRCPRDNKSLTAKVGQYGIYVCCCAAERHKYKLDEI